MMSWCWDHAEIVLAAEQHRRNWCTRTVLIKSLGTHLLITLNLHFWLVPNKSYIKSIHLYVLYVALFLFSTVSVRVCIGVAATKLQNKRVYPMACSTAAKSSMKVIRSVSTPTSLQYLCCWRLRKLLPSGADALRVLPLPPGLRHLLHSKLGWVLSLDHSYTHTNSNAHTPAGPSSGSESDGCASDPEACQRKRCRWTWGKHVCAHVRAHTHIDKHICIHPYTHLLSCHVFSVSNSYKYNGLREKRFKNVWDVNAPDLTTSLSALRIPFFILISIWDLKLCGSWSDMHNSVLFWMNRSCKRCAHAVWCIMTQQWTIILLYSVECSCSVLSVSFRGLEQKQSCVSPSHMNQLYKISVLSLPLTFSTVPSSYLCFNIASIQTVRMSKMDTPMHSWV